MRAPPPRWVLVVLNVVGILSCLGCLIFIKTVDVFTATVREPGIAVWVHTPFVAPGDRLILEVGLFGGHKAAIDNIVVRGEGIEREVEGTGKHWGSVITTKSTDVGQDSKRIELALPQSAEPGKTLVLSVGSTGTLAESTGFGTFSDRSTSRSIEVPIEVLSPGDKPWRKILSALRGLGALALVTLLLSRIWHSVVHFVEAADSPGEGGKSNGGSLGALAIGLAVGYCVAGIVVFAMPLRHATELVGDGWTALAVIAWIVIPPLAGRKLAGEAPPPPRVASLRPLEARMLDPKGGYREGAAIDYARSAGKEKIVAALEKIAGARVRASGRTLVISRRMGKETVWLELKVPAPAIGDITFTFSGIALALDVARALHTALGPFEITIGEIPLAIDGTKEPSDLASEWASGVSGKIRGMFGN